MSDYQILTVEQTAGGGLALRRKDADEVVIPGASPVIAAASGFPLILGDAAEGRKFLSVRIPFDPAQAGTGDPSPSNIRKLTPRTPALYRCGANLYTGEGDTANTGYNAQGVIGTSSMGIRITDHIPVSGESEVVLLIWGAPSTNRAVRAGAYDAEGTMLNGGALILDGGGPSGFFIYRVTLPAGTATIRVSLYGPLNLGVYAGSAAESLTLTLPDGSVGGGVWDPVNGTLTVTHKFYENAGTGNWAEQLIGGKRYYIGGVSTDAKDLSTNGISNIGKLVKDFYGNGIAVSSNGRINICGDLHDAFATVDDLKAYFAQNPLQLVYELASPVTYHLTPAKIAVLSGVNTLFHDAWKSGAGYDVTAEYVQDTGAAIEAANADTRAMIGEASGETASRSLAVGEYVTVGAALYRVTAAVGQGETLVPGTNVAETTVGAELVRLAGMLAQ